MAYKASTLLFCFTVLGTVTARVNVLTYNDSSCDYAFCGNGACVPGNFTRGDTFSCRCNDGWRRELKGSNFSFPFRPCTIPDCDYDNECASGGGVTDVIVDSASTQAPGNNFTIATLCNWMFCGAGDCIPSYARYTCACKDGYTNLNNTANFPCFKNCSFGGHCPSLGQSSQQHVPAGYIVPPLLVVVLGLISGGLHYFRRSIDISSKIDKARQWLMEVELESLTRPE